MRRYTIALYIRLSLEDAKYDSFSVDNQRDALRKYAQQMEEYPTAEVIEFLDNGFTGTTFERPAMNELLEMVRKNKVDCIIVKDFSRFGRNSIETGYFIEQVFPVYQTRFIAILDDYDSATLKDNTGGVECAFKYLLNEYYSKDLSKKSKTAKYSKMRKGEYQSQVCPYGYKKGINGRMEIDEDAAQIVRFLFQRILEGAKTTQIIHELYAQKIPTPGEYKAARGNHMSNISKSHRIWQRSTILRILGDERYTGTYIIGKREVVEVGSTRIRLKDESKWFRIENHNPAIVNKETFEQVAAMLQHFSSKKMNYRKYPLRGKVFCGCCDHALIKKPNKAIFICKHTKVDASFPCHGFQISEQEIETVLFDILKKQAQVVMNLHSENSLEDFEIAPTWNADYKEQIEQHNLEKELLYEQMRLKEIEHKVYEDGISAINESLERLHSTYKTVAAQAAHLASTEETKTQVVNLAKSIVTEGKLTIPLVDALVEKICVFPNNQLYITWKIADFSLV